MERIISSIKRRVNPMRKNPKEGKEGVRINRKKRRVLEGLYVKHIAKDRGQREGEREKTDERGQGEVIRKGDWRSID
ncbi:hypothetical protein BO79DRAFT_3561 [Aspergillus costaricaensis CBS 115574]|uniref:Uncharacterized protein n=1 Tax=Aspergillus costaricaensis CBS 115574 TaxID=1448317 RepID=A0ACD1IV52_9EURO|nr:hypothetical protein BO79DRAFT_3561 [Aspergillus costaricaensis CBS 115574]RAK94509.1 hypothetical protein BO79DRAFT_3561 [Aspergillus costaricaensis CBS 115574]